MCSSSSSTIQFDLWYLRQSCKSSKAIAKRFCFGLAANLRSFSCSLLPLTKDLRSLAVFARVSGYDTVLAADLEQYSSLLDFLAQDQSDRWEASPKLPLSIQPYSY